MRLLCALLLVLSATPLICAEVADEQVEEALKTWRHYEMPELPADAPLVVLGDRPPTYWLAFRVEAPDDYSQGRYFTGLRTDYESTPENTKIRPADLEVQNIGQFSGFGRSVFMEHNLLALGLHCWGRGDKELARSILQRVCGQKNWRVYGRYDAAITTLAEWVALTVWSYHGNELFEPGSDRDAAYKKLKEVHAEFLAAHTEFFPDFLAQLELTLAPSKSEPGSVEADIDAWTEVELPSGVFGGRLGLGLYGTLDSRFERVLHLGFDATPALIRMLGDQRLTRTILRHAFSGSLSLVTIGDLARFLLESMANRQFGIVLVPETRSWVTDGKEVEAWWTEATKAGEEAWFSGVAQPTNTWESAEIARRVLGAKYPETLAKIYVKWIESKEMYGLFEVPAILADSDLSVERKTELLTIGASSTFDGQKSAALEALARVNEAAFVKLSVAWFDSLAEAVKGGASPGYGLQRPAGIASLTTEPQVWRALERLADAIDVHARIRVLYGFRQITNEVPNADLRLRFLARYLNDKEEGQLRSAHFALATEWNTILVCDLSAFLIGEKLKTKPRPKSDWTEEDWTPFHDAVRKALTAAGIEPPKNK